MNMRFQKRYEGCRRIDPRNAMHSVALAFRKDGVRSEVSVSDMSIGGLQIEGASFAENEKFRLVIPQRGEINARVRWAAPGIAGAQFDEDLVLDGIMPARDRYVIQRMRTFNFGSGRKFGNRGFTAS